MMASKIAKTLGEIPSVDASGAAVECKIHSSEEFKKLTQNQEFKKLVRQCDPPENGRPPHLTGIDVLPKVDGYDTVELPCPPLEMRIGWEPKWFTKPTLRTQEWIDANECQEEHDHELCHEQYLQDVGDSEFPHISHNMFYDTLKRTLVQRECVISLLHTMNDSEKREVFVKINQHPYIIMGHNMDLKWKIQLRGDAELVALYARFKLIC